MTAPGRTFRARLFLAMTVVVTAATAGSLFLAQRSVAAAYGRIAAEEFENEARFFTELRRERLRAVQEKCTDLASSVRLLAALEEGDEELLQRIALDELRDVLRPDNPRRATFFRFVDRQGRVLPVSAERAGPSAGRDERWHRRMKRIAEAVAESDAAGEIGYLAAGPDTLEEVIVTRIVDPVTRRRLGALLVGFPAGAIGERAPERIRAGIWLDGRIHSAALAALPARARRLVERT
ncbi:MAG: hypothetical protein ACREQ9_26045, partial [Candidatus Binatia bacterium]